jgi:hypothetical protein
MNNKEIKQGPLVGKIFIKGDRFLKLEPDTGKINGYQARRVRDSYPYNFLYERIYGGFNPKPWIHFQGWLCHDLVKDDILRKGNYKELDKSDPRYDQLMIMLIE